MKIIKNLILLKIIILLFIIFFYSCNSVKKVNNITNSQFSILDSLSYVIFPDDNYSTEGNYYYKKIVSYKESIVPQLIEKIKDTITTNITIADAFNLKNGDIAFYLLLDLYYKKQFPVWAIITDEFKEVKQKNMEGFFDMTYCDLFLLNSEKKNYKNRIRLYNRIKNWYEEQQTGNFSAKNRKVNYADSIEKVKDAEYVYPKIHCCHFDTDSMQYIYRLPDYNSLGDAICERIVNNGGCFFHCLISKITDDRKTQIKYGVSYDFTVGDVAILLMAEIYRRKYLSEDKAQPIRKIIISEFYNNEDNCESLESLYISTFAFASRAEQIKNRYILQKRINEWYINDK